MTNIINFLGSKHISLTSCKTKFENFSKMFLIFKFFKIYLRTLKIIVNNL